MERRNKERGHGENMSSTAARIYHIFHKHLLLCLIYRQAMGSGVSPQMSLSPWSVTTVGLKRELRVLISPVWWSPTKQHTSHCQETEQLWSNHTLEKSRRMDSAEIQHNFSLHMSTFPKYPMNWEMQQLVGTGATHLRTQEVWYCPPLATASLLTHACHLH